MKLPVAIVLLALTGCNIWHQMDYGQAVQEQPRICQTKGGDALCLSTAISIRMGRNSARTFDPERADTIILNGESIFLTHPAQAAFLSSELPLDLMRFDEFHAAEYLAPAWIRLARSLSLKIETAQAGKLNAGLSGVSFSDGNAGLVSWLNTQAVSYNYSAMITAGVEGYDFTDWR